MASAPSGMLPPSSEIPGQPLHYQVHRLRVLVVNFDYIVSPIYEWKFSPFINTGIQEGLLLTSNHNFLRNDRLAMEDRMCQCFTWGGYLHILAAWLLTLEHYHKVTTIFFPLHDLSPRLWELHWVTPRWLSLWKVTKSPTSKILGN